MTRGFVSFAMLVIAAAALTTVTAERAPLGFEVEPAVMAAAVDDFQGASVADGDAGPLTFVADGPCVLWETRTGRPAPLDDGIGKIGSSTANGDTQTFATRGAAVEAQPNNGAPDCETEPNAMAALVNVVALNPDNGGNLKAWSPEEAEPEGGIVNFEADNNSNAVALTLATNGDVNVKANGGPVDTRGVYLGSFVPGEPVANVISVSADGTDLDNGTDLRNAIDSATAGTLVDIGPGTYDLDTGGVSVPNGVTLLGAGAERTRILCGCDGFVMQAQGNLTVRDVTLESNGVTSDRGVLFGNVASVHVEVVDSNLIISGSGASHRLFDLLGADSTVVLERLSMSSISHEVSSIGTLGAATLVRIRDVELDYLAEGITAYGFRLRADELDIDGLSITGTSTSFLRPILFEGTFVESVSLRHVDITTTADSATESRGIQVFGAATAELADVNVTMSGGESNLGIYFDDVARCDVSDVRADISAAGVSGEAVGLEGNCAESLDLVSSDLRAIGDAIGYGLYVHNGALADVGFSRLEGTTYGAFNSSAGPTLTVHDSVVTGGTAGVQEIATNATSIFRSTLTGGVVGTVACYHVVTETGVDLSPDCSDPT